MLLCLVYVHSEATLTLFTSFSRRENRKQIEENTIVNWRWLGRKITRLNFYDRLNKREVQDIPSWINVPVSRHRFGLPIVRHMYLDAQRVSPLTDFYAFANADILFCSDLLETLEAIKKHRQEIDPYNTLPYLIVGKRRNIDIERIRAVKENLLEEFYQDDFFNECAIDYFISARNLTLWNQLDDFVIAKLGWDTYTLAYAVHLGLQIYDASDTITAIHQSFKGKFSSGSASPNHKLINRELRALSQKRYKQKFGYIRNTTFVTRKVSGNIIIK